MTQPQLFGDGDIAEMPEKLCTEALAIWNEFAPGAGWPAAKFLTQSRRTALRRAVKDYGGLVGWREHLSASSRNDFLTGKSSRDPKHANWRPDIDWFCKPANVLKVLEGKWPADHAPPAQGGGRIKLPTTVDWKARLGRYKPRGFWHVDTEGPRPEDPGPHKAPVELIQAWRTQHGLGDRRAPASETRAQRMAASIVAYRKIGRYAEANRIEQELAALEGRPPVEVPASDARDPDTMPPPINRGRPAAPRSDGPPTIDVPPEAYSEVPEGWDDDDAYRE